MSMCPGQSRGDGSSRERHRRSRSLPSPGRSCAIQLWLPRALPGNPDGEAGMRWWDALTELQRAYWLGAAGSARPVDAWRAYLRRAADMLGVGEAQW